MAKKKPAASSPQKKGKEKPTARDSNTSEEALKAAIEKQKAAIAEAAKVDPFGMNGDPSDPMNLVETLLDVPNRKPLDMGDEVRCNNALIRFVIDRPGQYKMFCSLLTEKVGLNAAIWRSGFATPSKVKTWIRQGVIDSENDLDTYCSRLYLDTSRSLAVAVSDVEIQVSVDKPLDWLRNGPGRLIEAGWRDDPARVSTKDVFHHSNGIENQDADVLRLPSKKEDDDTIEGEIIEQEGPADENTFLKALEVLRASGVSPEQQPEGWDKALRVQGGEELSEEELEVKEQDSSDISLGSNESVLTEQLRQAQSSEPC